MMKHESPSISETTKPMYLKIGHNVKNVKYCSQMQYDDVTTNPIWRTVAILKIVFWLYLRDFIVRLMRNLVHYSTIMFRHWSINNFRKFKMANGRHFENSFIAISQPRIVRFKCNLVCRCIFRF